jgi:hypothetical protein
MKRNKFIKAYIYSIIIMTFIGLLTFKIIYELKKEKISTLYEKVKNYPKGYAYEVYYGSLNSVLYIKDLKYRFELEKIYMAIENKEIYPLNIPLDYLPLFDSIIIGDTLFNKFIKVYSFDTVNWELKKGYAYYKTIHNSPPADSLLEKKKNFYERFK